MMVSIILLPEAFSQEFSKATFSESIVVVYDLSLYKETGNFLVKKSAGDVEVAIGLQSTSNEDFKFSDEFIAKVKSEDIVQSIAFTNMVEIDHTGTLIGCLPGVEDDEQCILVNLNLDEIKKFITEEDLLDKSGRINRVQIESQRIGDSLIDEINNSFGLNAKFHSVFLQPVNDESTKNKIVSAVYVSEKQSSIDMLNNFSDLLITDKITNGGGFYDIAKEFAKDETRDLTLYSGEIVGQTITPSTLSLTIFPTDDGMRYLLNVSVTYYNAASNIAEIDPLEYLNITELQRSKYFEGEFVPLDSLLDVLILTPEAEPVMIGSANTNVIEKISNVSDISNQGWFFDSSYGDFIAGKFLFGKNSSVSNDELKLEIIQWDGSTEAKIQSSVLEEVTLDQVTQEENFQSQYVILVVIIVVAVAAAIYYMKGYKTKN